MTKQEALRLYRKLYWLRLDLDKHDEQQLDEVLYELQDKFCTKHCRNGDLTDGGLFTSPYWCDCPLGQESAKAKNRNKVV